MSLAGWAYCRTEVRNSSRCIKVRHVTTSLTYLISTSLVIWWCSLPWMEHWDVTHVSNSCLSSNPEWHDINPCIQFSVLLKWPTRPCIAASARVLLPAIVSQSNSSSCGLRCSFTSSVKQTPFVHVFVFVCTTSFSLGQFAGLQRFRIAEICFPPFVNRRL
jgi:hypothetical protein